MSGTVMEHEEAGLARGAQGLRRRSGDAVREMKTSRGDVDEDRRRGWLLGIDPISIWSLGTRLLADEGSKEVEREVGLQEVEIEEERVDLDREWIPKRTR